VRTDGDGAARVRTPRWCGRAARLFRQRGGSLTSGRQSGRIAPRSGGTAWVLGDGGG
jgi:hypothetical protein